MKWHEELTRLESAQTKPHAHYIVVLPQGLEREARRFLCTRMESDFNVVLDRPRSTYEIHVTPRLSQDSWHVAESTGSSYWKKP